MSLTSMELVSKPEWQMRFDRSTWRHVMSNPLKWRVPSRFARILLPLIDLLEKLFRLLFTDKGQTRQAALELE